MSRAKMCASITGHRAFQAGCDHASSVCSWGLGCVDHWRKGEGGMDINIWWGAWHSMQIPHLVPQCMCHISAPLVQYINMYTFFLYHWWTNVKIYISLCSRTRCKCYWDNGGGLGERKGLTIKCLQRVHHVSSTKWFDATARVDHKLWPP